MITITLPNGDARQYAAGVTGMEIAKSISDGLARNAVGIIVNGIQPVINLGNATVLEHPGVTNQANFPVWLSSPSSAPVSVNYATYDGSARAGTYVHDRSRSDPSLPRGRRRRLGAPARQV